MEVRLIYTDAEKNEQGILQSFSADVDVANDKDFEITVAQDNHILRAGALWYINGTEYGGIVDKIGVVTADREIKYTGRNLRGILCDKIIEPPSGENYRTVSGDAITIINGLIMSAGLGDMYRMAGETWNIASYQFSRYITLYDGISALIEASGKVLRLVVNDGFVTMYVSDPVDHTLDNDYMFTGDADFSVVQVCNNYNHLICLGQGELKDRQVLHLYLDNKGNLTDKPVYTDINERVAVYDYSSAESIEELKAGGIARLQELNADSFDMTLPDTGMNIGDLIGGTEPVTGMTVKKQITNIIAKIDDNSIDIEYSVS